MSSQFENSRSESCDKAVGVSGEFPFTAEVTVEKYLCGVRVDSFLERHFRNYTSFRLQRLVRARQVRIEGVTAEVDDRVRTGQVVSIRLLEPPDKMLPPQELPVEVLYEDPWMVVVNKPVGQVVHPCGNYHRETLLNALQHYFDRQTTVPGLLRPGIVHRLDRLTSGVTVIAKDHIANRRLSDAFENGKVRKTYLALVHGEVQGDLNTVNLPIGVVPGGESFLMTTAADAVDARPSRTTFETLERLGDYSLVKAQPITGRMHQIRVHVASLGHPILADEFYGPDGPVQLGPRNYRPPESIPGGQLMDRQALHAFSLRIMHPITRLPLYFEAPLPPDFEQALGELRRRQGAGG